MGLDTPNQIFRVGFVDIAQKMFAIKSNCLAPVIAECKHDMDVSFYRWRTEGSAWTWDFIMLAFMVPFCSLTRPRPVAWIDGGPRARWHCNFGDFGLLGWRRICSIHSIDCISCRHQSSFRSSIFQDKELLMILGVSGIVYDHNP